MPVPVPKQVFRPSHQVIKPLSKGSVTRSADRSSFQYVIHNRPRQPCVTSSDYQPQEERLNPSLNWRTDGSHPIGGAAVEGCIRSASKPPVSQELQRGLITTCSAAGGEQSSADHLVPTVSKGGDKESAIMTWLMGLAPMPAKDASSPGYEADDDMAQAVNVPKKASISDFHISGGHLNAFQPFDITSSHTMGEGGLRGIENPSGTFMQVPEAPVTPFASYVDKVAVYEATIPSQHFVLDSQQGVPAVETPRLEPPSPERLTDPAYIRAYHCLSEPLADWLADYVWKVCTTGYSLEQRFAGFRSMSQSLVAEQALCRYKSGRLFADKPPVGLAKSIRVLVGATLLQPSGLALALWYIARLPVFFERGSYIAELSHEEAEFRSELLGDGCSNISSMTEMTDRAPFRVLILGCMLANKWLDDHTFSNKTWHAITSVPLRSINRLEHLALAVLSYDLSVPTLAWDQWLSHLRQYHVSSTPFPSPIRRPSTADSSTLVRDLVDDLIALHGLAMFGTDGSSAKSYPQPVFSSLLGKDNGIYNLSTDASSESYDIDLDEDGPLREEYIPRRRCSQRSSCSSISKASAVGRVDPVRNSSQSSLPPPADWSPQADPPIVRQQDRRDRYIAVQPLASRTVQVGNVGSNRTHHHWWVEPRSISSTGYDSAAPARSGNVSQNSQPSAPIYTYLHVNAPRPDSHSRSTLIGDSGRDASHFQASIPPGPILKEGAFPYFSGSLLSERTFGNEQDPSHFRPRWLHA